MPNPCSVLERLEAKERRSSRLPGDIVLMDAFKRIEDCKRFSSRTPEVTAYDDFHYDDCGYTDAPW